MMHRRQNEGCSEIVSKAFSALGKRKLAFFRSNFDAEKYSNILVSRIDSFSSESYKIFTIFN